MDIKSWILLVGTALIVAVVCHGFWTAYRSRRSDMRMEIEADIPQGDLDEMVLLRGELPNGGARVTPTVGYESLRVKDRPVFTQGAVSSSITSRTDLLDLPPDEVAEFAEEETLRAASAQQKHSPDESNPDAGYEPEQVTLDLTLDGLEENHAARLAAAGPSGNDSDRPADEQSATTALLSSAAGGKKAPLLLDAANTPLGVHSAEMSASQPRKKLIAPKDQPPPRSSSNRRYRAKERFKNRRSCVHKTRRQPQSTPKLRKYLKNSPLPLRKTALLKSRQKLSDSSVTSVFVRRPAKRSRHQSSRNWPLRRMSPPGRAKAAWLSQARFRGAKSWWFSTLFPRLQSSTEETSSSCSCAMASSLAT